MTKYEFMVENDNGDTPSIKDVWQGLNQTTTAHGLPRAYQYRGKCFINTVCNFFISGDFISLIHLLLCMMHM